MEKAEENAQAFASKQMQLDLPGIEKKDDSTKTSRLPTNLEILVGIPTIKELSGESAEEKQVAAYSNINIEITELQSKQNVEFAIQYVKWLDRYIPDVYKEALKHFEADKIQEEINIKQKMTTTNK